MDVDKKEDTKEKYDLLEEKASNIVDEICQLESDIESLRMELDEVRRRQRVLKRSS